MPGISASRDRPPVVVWSDAMWQDMTGLRAAFGGLGFVIWLPAGHHLASPLRGRFMFSAREVGLGDLPFLDSNHHLIGQAELLAAAAVYTSVPEAFRGQDVIHFIDNSGALYGLTKGRSSVPDCERIIRSFHVLNMSLRANVWFNYVATKANVADPPSRLAIGEMADVLRSFEPSFDLVRDRVRRPRHPGLPARHVRHVGGGRPAAAWARRSAVLSPVARRPPWQRSPLILLHPPPSSSILFSGCTADEWVCGVLPLRRPTFLGSDIALLPHQRDRWRERIPCIYS